MFNKNLVKRRDWKDLGQKSGGSTSMNETYYPSIYLDSKQVGILPVEAGKEVTLMLKAKVKSINITSDTNGGSASYSLDLLKMKLVNGAKSDNIDEEIE